MRRLRCPYCNNANVIDDEEWGQIVQCEAPACRRVFHAGGEQPSEPVPPPPLPPPLPVASSPPPATALPAPHLTGPHICHACRGQINQALNHRRATIVHRLPASGDQPAGPPAGWTSTRPSTTAPTRTARCCWKRQAISGARSSPVRPARRSSRPPGTTSCTNILATPGRDRSSVSPVRPAVRNCGAIRRATAGRSAVSAWSAAVVAT